MTFMVYLLLGLVAGTVLSIPLIIGIVYQTAKNDRQLTFRSTGEIKFKASGDKLVELVMDIPGKKHDWGRDEIVDLEDAEPGNGKFVQWLIKRFSKANFDELQRNRAGIAYVSIFYPVVHIKSWDFDWPKLVPLTAARQAEGEGNLLEKYAIVQKNAKVKSLFYEFIYPALAQNIELKGNFIISVLFQVTFTVEKPVYLIGNLKGKFMSQAISEAIGILDSALRDLTIEQWRDEDRFEKVRETFKGKTVLSGALNVKVATYVDFDYSGNSPEVIKAITLNQIRVAEAEALMTQKTGEGKALVAQKTSEANAAVEEGRKINTLAKAKAEATVTEAQAAKAALVLRGEGEAARLKSVITEVTARPEGVAIYAAEQQAEGIRGFTSPGTLVIGKPDHALVTVPTNEGKGGGK